MVVEIERFATVGVPDPSIAVGGQVTREIWRDDIERAFGANNVNPPLSFLSLATELSAPSRSSFQFLATFFEKMSMRSGSISTLPTFETLATQERAQPLRRGVALVRVLQVGSQVGGEEDLIFQRAEQRLRGSRRDPRGDSRTL